MEIIFDKNGNVLKKGQWIRLLATHIDYNCPKIVYITDEFKGQKFNELIIVDGETFESLSKYRNGDTRYHSVEIFYNNSTVQSNDGWEDHNLNDYVRFKLTEKGKKLIMDLNNTDEFYKKCPLHFTQVDSWYESQLWEIANIFGHTFGNGFDNYIETSIKIKKCQ